jgi:hypothetical protein
VKPSPRGSSRRWPHGAAPPAKSSLPRACGAPLGGHAPRGPISSRRRFFSKTKNENKTQLRPPPPPPLPPPSTPRCRPCHHPAQPPPSLPPPSTTAAAPATSTGTTITTSTDTHSSRATTTARHPHRTPPPPGSATAGDGEEAICRRCGHTYKQTYTYIHTEIERGRTCHAGLKPHSRVVDAARALGH